MMHRVCPSVNSNGLMDHLSFNHFVINGTPSWLLSICHLFSVFVLAVIHGSTHTGRQRERGLKKKKKKMADKIILYVSV